jgi:RIO kinase 1
MAIDAHARAAIEPFIHDGLVSDILYEVKSGKEATVFCCAPGAPGTPGTPGTPSAPGPGAGSGGTRILPLPTPGLLAAKVYRPIESRRFKDDSIYLAGRVHMVRAGRARRAVEQKSAFGREVQYATWLEQEWEMLRRLHAAGADVPAVITRSDSAILMPFLGGGAPRCGNGGEGGGRAVAGAGAGAGAGAEGGAGAWGGPAPLLNGVELGREETECVLDRLLWNIELMLDCHVVHGDLSPFNVLYVPRESVGGDGGYGPDERERPVIIDFPQSVDPRLNPAARLLLERDIVNLCRWAAKRGVHRDGAAMARDLWRRFELGEIG